MDEPLYPNRLRELRAPTGQSQTEVAQAIGVTQQHYQRMEAWKQRLNMDHLQRLGRFFGVDWQDIVIDPRERPQRVPVLDEVQAGEFAEAKGDARLRELGEIDAWVSVEYPKRTIFALRVRGDSMDNIIADGGVVVVDWSIEHLEDRELGVFRLADGRATFKRFRRDRSGEWLQPDSSNERHAPIFGSEETQIEIIGKVVAFQLPRPDGIGGPEDRA